MDRIFYLLKNQHGKFEYKSLLFDLQGSPSVGLNKSPCRMPHLHKTKRSNISMTDYVLVSR